MSHRAQVIVIRNRFARRFVDRWVGARVLDALAEGPDGCERAIELLTPTALADHGIEAGWLVDFDARELVVFGDPSTRYEGEEPQDRSASDLGEWKALVLPLWSSFTVTWADDEGRFESYLRSRGPRLREGLTDADVDELERRLDHALAFVDDEVAAAVTVDEERRAAALQVAAPDPPRGSFAIKPLLFAMLPVALVLRLLTIPFRARLRARAARLRREARAERLREALALSASMGDRPHAIEAIEARYKRGFLLLSLGKPHGAERDFDACVRHLEAASSEGGQSNGPSLPIALFNRGASRHRIGLQKLGAQDKARATELGMRRVERGGFRLLLAPLWWSFLALSGIHTDE